MVGAEASGHAARGNRDEDLVRFGLQQAAETAVEGLRFDPNNLAAYLVAADYSSQAHESATAVDYLVTLLLKLRIAHRIQKVVDIPESGFLKTIVSVFLRDTWSAGSRERAAEVAFNSLLVSSTISLCTVSRLNRSGSTLAMAPMMRTSVWSSL